MSEPVRIVGIFLVDSHGRVLLQERDEHAPIAPDQWGVVGGHVEPGEDPVAARDRELLEETGLVVPGDAWMLWLDGLEWRNEQGNVTIWQVWVARVDLTDADVVCGEGRQIVFVDPKDFDDLPLSESLVLFLPQLLESAPYRTRPSAAWREAPNGATWPEG